MDTATVQPLPLLDIPKVPQGESSFAPVPAEKAPTTNVDAKDHTDHEVNGASGPGDKTSTAAAPSNTGGFAKGDLNGHTEASAVPEKTDGHPRQDTKDHHEPEAVSDNGNANGSVSVTSNDLKGDAMTADAVKEECNGIYKDSRTNGQQEDSVTAPANHGPFDDIWSPATRLKRRLEETKDLIVCPGVYDGFSARIALSVGFDTMYMTGAGTTASRLGMADLGVASRTDMKEHADMLANLDPSKMLIADMDTGYGGPITITTTVNQYIRANVAGFHIEDQVLTKRCGHLAGKQVVSQDVYLSRIKAAKAAKDKARSDIVLIARTDANQQHGYDECLTRLRAARDIGADVGLLEGFKSKEEARRAVKDLAPWPLLLNIVENGHSPLITVDEARDMGFRIMIFSFGALVPAYLAIKGAFERLMNEGVTGVHETDISPKSIFDVCGLEEAMEADENAGGEGFKGGV